MNEVVVNIIVSWKYKIILRHQKSWYGIVVWAGVEKLLWPTDLQNMTSADRVTQELSSSLLLLSSFKSLNSQNLLSSCT
jgi:hypothetical protein